MKEGSDYKHEFELLQEYNKALQKQNSSRNQQRKILYQEIERLTQIEKDVKLNINSTNINIHQHHEYLQIIEIKQKLENTLHLTLIQNTNLQQQITTWENKYYNLEIKYNQCLRKSNSESVSYNSTTTNIGEENHRRLEELQREGRFKDQQIQRLKGEGRFKDQEIQRLRIELLSKEENLTKLKKQLSNYLVKINQLSQQLGSLESHQQYRVIEKDQSVFHKGQVEKYAAINASLVGQLNSLKIENTDNIERNRDLERRIMILEETNLSLQREVKILIENKKSASRMHVYSKQEEELKEMIRELRREVQELKKYNLEIYEANQELSIQLQEENSKTSQFCKLHSHSPLASKLVLQNEKHYHSKVESKTDYFNIEGYNLHKDSHHNHNHRHNHNHNHNYQSQISNKSSKSPQAREEESRKWRDLQRKINGLQNENKVLKKQLVYEI